jgi:DNA-directed RNA polymerase subunit K/omega
MSDEESYSSEEIPELDEADQADDIDLLESEDDLSDYDDAEESEEEPETVYGELRKDKNHAIIHIVPDDERDTSDVIQKHEITEAVGIRTSQIEMGAPVFTDVAGLTDPNKMAWKEFYDRKNPLILERKITELPEKNIFIVEHWKVREMVYLL